MSAMKVRQSLALAVSPKFNARHQFRLALACAFCSRPTENDVLGTLRAADYSAVIIVGRMTVHVGAKLLGESQHIHDS